MEEIFLEKISRIYFKELYYKDRAQKIIPLYTGIFTHNIKLIVHVTGHFTLYDIHY